MYLVLILYATVGGGYRAERGGWGGRGDGEGE